MQNSRIHLHRRRPFAISGFYFWIRSVVVYLISLEQENPTVCENGNFSEYAILGYNLISSSDIPSSVQASHQKHSVLSTVNTNVPNKRRMSSCANVQEKKGISMDEAFCDQEPPCSVSFVRELESKYEIAERKRKFLSKRVIELAGSTRCPLFANHIFS